MNNMDSGMSEQEQPSWLDIIRPSSVSVILGNKGKGKSGLAYYLAEVESKEHALLPVVVNLPEQKRHLLPDSFIIKSLKDVRRLEDSVVIIDEGTTMLPAGQKKLEELVKGFVALSRQRNQIVIFVFHSSSDVGSRILRGVDVILLKEPSRRQIQFGSKDSWFRETLLEAKERFRTIEQMNNDTRRYTFVDCEQPDFRGILENKLPSFWSEELSNAWASVDMEEAVTGQVALPMRARLEELTTQERLNMEIGHLFPGGITDKILDTLIAYDGNYSLEQLKKMCIEAGVSPHGHKKLLAARLLLQQRGEE